MAVSPVLVAARQYMAQLDAIDAAASQRLIDNYLQSWRRLEAMLNALLLEIGDAVPTRAQLIRMERYKALMQQIAVELAGLQMMTENEIDSIGANILPMGEQHSRNLTAIALLLLAGLSLQPANIQSVSAQLNSVTPDAIDVLTGWLQPGSPLFERLRMLAGVNADLVAKAMIDGITRGLGPREIARMVKGAFGRGLADALRFVRTANLWAYREANRASMIANQSVLEGWVWDAHLDKKTCMSCVVMHGTIHPVTETLNDHYNGRCASIPLVNGFENPIAQTGVDWFNMQEEWFQRRMMGREFYDAWRGGAFDLSEMSTIHRDEVYGDMRVEARLWQLLGAEPPVRILQEAQQ